MLVRQHTTDPFCFLGFSEFSVAEVAQRGLDLFMSISVFLISSTYLLDRRFIERVDLSEYLVY